MLMNAKPVVFLDTSIQIQRFIGPKERQVAIERELKQAASEFVTSSYVFMEFQRSLWSDFVYVYNQLRQAQDWGTVAYQLRSGVRSHRPRALGNCLQIFTWALIESNLDYDKALDFLELQITQNLPEDFWLHVTPLPDPIGCDLVNLGIRPQPGGQFDIANTCRKETAACLLPTFLTHQSHKLHSLADHLATHPRAIKDQARVERLLAAVIQGPQSALGQSACWPVGDIILALQVPANASVWTLDTDFQPLAEALEIRLYIPTFSKVS